MRIASNPPPSTRRIAANCPNHPAASLEGCPGSGCRFWEPAGWCVLKQVDLVDRPLLARWLRRPA